MAEYTRILLRQGPDSLKNSVILKSGEPAFINDYERLVIGDGNTPGGVTIGSKFLGFCEFDPVSLEVFNVSPGYPGDIIFETSTNLMYVLSGGETVIGKKAYQIKTNYQAINKTPLPDGQSIVDRDSRLSIRDEGVDGRHIATYALGNGLRKNVSNPLIIEIKQPSEELSFVDGRLQITQGGVLNEKLSDMGANTVKGRLNESGAPEDISIDALKRALGLITEGGAGGFGVPVGTIIDYAGLNSPVNYLPCDGRELVREEFIELFGAIGNTWGQPTLSTFNLPNLNKRTTIGSGSPDGTGSSENITETIGSYGGAQSTFLASRNLPTHSHKVDFTVPGHVHTFTVNLPQVGGAFEVGDIVTNGYNNYIVTIQGNGPDAAPQTVPPGPDANSNIRNEAFNLIKTNKPYIQQRVIDYVNSVFPYALSAFYTDSRGNTGLSLSAVCYRDAGYITDSIAADILNNANHRSVETANLYFSGFITSTRANVNGRSVPSLPQDQYNPTVKAIESIGSFIAGINIPLSPLQKYTNLGILSSSIFHNEEQKVIISGLSNFTTTIANSGVVPVTTPSNNILLDVTYAPAASSIKLFKSNLQKRVVDYVNFNFPYALSGTSFLNGDSLSAKCFRDSGYIIDSIVADILNNSNHRSVETGLFYFSGAVLARNSAYNSNVPTLPQDQVFATIQAISSIGKFITGLTMPVENTYTTNGILSSSIYYNNSQNKALSSLSNFTSIIQTGNQPPTYPSGGGISTNSSYATAANLILRYRSQLQQQVVDYVKFNFPDALLGNDPEQTASLSAKCFRDTGYIVDALAADIRNNANHRSVETGLFYFNGAVLNRLSNPGSSVPTLPENQINATIAAISALEIYINGSNIPSVPTPFTTVGILSATSGGESMKPDVANLVNTMHYPLRTSGSQLSFFPAGSATSDDVALSNLLLSARSSIQSTVSSYVFKKNYLSTVPSTFIVNTEKCNRDVGYMIDAIINDLKTGVNARSIQYGVAYWDGSTSRIPDSNIPNQRENTLDVIRYLSSVMEEVMVNNSNVLSNTAIKKINSLIKTMVYPLENNGSTLPYQPAGVTTQNNVDVADRILTNKETIQNAVTNYVVYKQYLNAGSDLLVKCRRDVGFMIDAIANDLITGVNAKSVQYALSYWDGSASRLREIPGSEIANQRKNTIDTIEFLLSQLLNYATLPGEENILSEVLSLTRDMVYPLNNKGTLPLYRPAGPTLTPDRQTAISVLTREKTRIQKEIREYVKSLGIITSQPSLQEKCNRDVGYMIDSIMNDLKTGVNARSIQYALTYWDGTKNRIGGGGIVDGLTAPNQIFATVNTLKRLRDLTRTILVQNGVGETGDISYNSTTNMTPESATGKYVFDGFTGSGEEQLYNDPISNMQPSAVVNKCIKAR